MEGMSITGQNSISAASVDRGRTSKCPKTQVW